MTSLLDRRLLVVAGKGGVGRTTVAAALAVVAARRGKRVLLAQTRAKERLGRLLGCAPAGTDVRRASEGLWIVNMSPEAALREYGTMTLHSSLLYRAVFENRLARAFIRAIPGVEDYSMLGKVWFHTTEREGGRPRFDLVVLDGPATGHMVTLLQIPGAILEAVPDGPLTRDARSAHALITDPARCRAVIVTLAEELPANEAVDLADRLRRRVGVSVGPLIVNQLYPPRFSSGPSSQALRLLPPATGGPIDPLLADARIAQRRRELNDRHLARLARDLPLPQLQLPYLFAPDLGRAEIDDLARRLEGQLAHAAAD